VIVISPVLATANTAVATVDRLKERGANDILSLAASRRQH
jgi:uracil phosphoribosyltransferase